MMIAIDSPPVRNSTFLHVPVSHVCVTEYYSQHSGKAITDIKKKIGEDRLSKSEGSKKCSQMC